tara:strand:- start:174 stop:413 length:240 start_codon:yes stop_codon:yes gene_type:complete
MKYLLFNTEQDAKTRSEQAATEKGYPDYSRIWSAETEHGGGRAYLQINGDYLYLLTPTETSALVNELPADWTHPPPPFE